jgi:hypothetical protein
MTKKSSGVLFPVFGLVFGLTVFASSAGAVDPGPRVAKKKGMPVSSPVHLPEKAATSCTTDADCPVGKCCWKKDNTCLKCTNRSVDGEAGGATRDGLIQGSGG